MSADFKFEREDYLFELPPERIAQTPAARRDASKLLVAGAAGPLEHRTFAQIGGYLRRGDVLVINQTKVMNARCFAVKENGVKIEIFVLGIPADPAETQVLAKPAKRLKPDIDILFPHSGVRARVVAKHDQGRHTLAFESLDALSAVLAQDGELPLPPYIKREQGPSETDGDRYQTVFARELGAVAAPTAGLHFTEGLLAELAAAGVEILRVTHHVGIGTFKPLVAEDIRDHLMESESYFIDEGTVTRLDVAKSEGRRIIAVGTTSTRCLESNYDDGFHPGHFATDLYIYPGYSFRAIDALITNFHLPGSSLILLVSALMGHDRIMDIYREAIGRDYRFYSYGDAMLLLPRQGEIDA
ncbi:tRNA preQ1(34) S-adenosylmethionine ribosyltransferase-isomerase QueA [Sulfidibacter corallicola]|uniref:S-adenosylmethionine:tRNA ribosyltransferase-isomerase n=1 Tax=Sulfidibacter corallicola TaxID=2818388 RepID=A0A8A4TVJ9_SULCO|nr:tRNA preQ1(34) S-adenosylmethionine ribosyltransferase-isomerase QueA [Sulfidibacter corallicola]QTD53154.1 tRNA preQ1(34) S-adenosylmethionine ribosyltransferase-isomerase QueA [Sulfidibacter corallicola]